MVSGFEGLSGSVSIVDRVSVVVVEREASPVVVGVAEKAGSRSVVLPPFSKVMPEMEGEEVFAVTVVCDALGGPSDNSDTGAVGGITEVAVEAGEEASLPVESGRRVGPGLVVDPEATTLSPTSLGPGSSIVGRAVEPAGGAFVADVTEPVADSATADVADCCAGSCS